MFWAVAVVMVVVAAGGWWLRFECCVSPPPPPRPPPSVVVVPRDVSCCSRPPRGREAHLATVFCLYSVAAEIAAEQPTDR